MGVTGFYTALTKMFPWAAKKLFIRNGRAWIEDNNARRIPFSPDFVHLFFDCNSELYSAAGKLGEDELDHMSVKLWESLDSLIKAVSAPSPSSIFLALDGPAPHAKLYSQRQRRMKRFELPEGFDSVAFTPGSAVMRHVKDALVYFSCKRLTDNPKFAKTQFFVSGADREGEGEFKLFEHLAHIPPTQKREPAVIVGNDSDLVLFALSCRSSYHLHVLRTMRKAGQFELWDIEELRASILKMCHASVAPEKVISDFVTLSLLRGNDYLPSMRYISFHQLWSRYCSASASHNKSIVDTARLAPDWTALKQLWATSARQSTTSHMREKALQHFLSKFDPKVFLVRLYEKVEPEKALKFEASEVDTANGAPVNENELPFQCTMTLGDIVLSSARGLTGRQASVLVAAQKLRELISAGDAMCLQLARTAEMETAVLTRLCDDLIALLSPSADKLLPSNLHFTAPAETKGTGVSEMKKMQKSGEESFDSSSSSASDNTAEDSDLDLESPGSNSLAVADHSKARLQSYLLGVVWAHLYYGGDCLDYTWSYSYRVGPTFAELADSKEYPLNFPRKDNTPVLPIECLLLLMPPNRKALLPPEFRSIPDLVPDLRDVTTMTDKWRTPELILSEVRAQIEKITASLSHELRRDTLAFRPTLCLTRSPQKHSSALGGNGPSYSLGHGKFPSLWRVTDVMCTAENRTMKTPRVYDVPYTDDKGEWHSGRFIGKAKSDPETMKRSWSEKKPFQRPPSSYHYQQQQKHETPSSPYPPPRTTSSSSLPRSATMPPVKSMRTISTPSAFRVLLNVASKFRV